MFGIETREIGVYNFDYFSADLTGSGSLRMGGREFTLGAFSRDIANLSKEYMTGLLTLCGELNLMRKRLLLLGGYDRELYQNIRRQIHRILESIAKEKPFCYFNITDSARVTDEVFSEDALDENDALRKGLIPPDTQDGQARIQKIKERFKYANGLVSVYCYLGVDAANFGTMLLNFTETFMQTNARAKEDLAAYTYGFFGDKEILAVLESTNPSTEFAGITLRPRVTQIPIVAFDQEKEEPSIARRLYFGRLMDFLVTEWFEAMMRGHYLWRCRVCGRYFLMTTAHRQFYCGQYNEQYGTTCDHVANNRRLGRDKGIPRQKRKDSPLWVFRNKRYASIRKNKSLGKYDEAVSAEAKRILDEYYEEAELDAEYADHHYLNDIRLENIYARAAARVKEK